MAKEGTGKLVAPESPPDQCAAEISIEIAPGGIRLASSTHATGVAPMPGAPAEATGSGLLLGPVDLPFDLPLLPCANSAVGMNTTSALSTSALAVNRASMLFVMLARRSRRGRGRRRRPGRRASGGAPGGRASGRRAAGAGVRSAEVVVGLVLGMLGFAAAARRRAERMNRLAETLVLHDHRAFQIGERNPGALRGVQRGDELPLVPEAESRLSHRHPRRQHRRHLGG